MKEYYIDLAKIKTIIPSDVNLIHGVINDK